MKIFGKIKNISDFYEVNLSRFYSVPIRVKFLLPKYYFCHIWLTIQIVWEKVFGFSIAQFLIKIISYSCISLLYSLNFFVPIMWHNIQNQGLPDIPNHLLYISKQRYSVHKAQCSGHYIFGFSMHNNHQASKL